MSFTTEAAPDTGNGSNLGEAVNEGASPRAASSGGGSHHEGDLGGEGSESESYVEVEQLGEDTTPAGPNFAPLAPGGTSPAGVVRHVAKRTLITLHQRSVLEEYYRVGMTSASQQMVELHETVAAKTGLDISVVRVSFVRTCVCVSCRRFGLINARLRV